MTPKQAVLSIWTAILARRPIFIWGPPGVGKSSIVAQFALQFFATNGGDLRTVNLRDVLRDVRAVLLDPVDVKGLPVPDLSRQVVTWLIAEFFPRDGKGILFLDELNAAPRLVQAALYQLILDRRIGEYVLPDGWHIVAAGNREGDRAIVERLSTALASRFGVHIELEASAIDFIEYGATHDFHPVILAMIKAKPKLLFDFDPKLAQRTFSCPRTLEFASDTLKVWDANPHLLQSTNARASIELEHLQGICGVVGAEIAAWRRYMAELPDVAKILADPKSAPVPDIGTPRGVGILSLTCGILSRIATRQNFAPILTYASRIAEEFAIFLVVTATARDASLKSTAEFIRFASTHSELMI